MKTICFIRHAKSDWSQPGQSDRDRRLNQRGLRDAPIMASELKKRIPSVDLILSSSAERTRLTSSYFQEAYGLADDNLMFSDDLYLPDVSDVFKVISGLNSRYQHICVVGHNPAWSSILQYYGGWDMGNMPTCGIAIVDIDVEDWLLVSAHSGKVRDFIYPKMFV